MQRAPFLAAATALALTTALATATASPTAASPTAASPTAASPAAFSPATAQAPDTTALARYTQAMVWRDLGPTRGGRSVTATGVVGDDRTYYFGATGGGVWKTADAGITWTNVSDGHFGDRLGRGGRRFRVGPERRVGRNGRARGARRDHLAR